MRSRTRARGQRTVDQVAVDGHGLEHQDAAELRGLDVLAHAVALAGDDAHRHAPGQRHRAALIGDAAGRGLGVVAAQRVHPEEAAPRLSQRVEDAVAGVRSFVAQPRHRGVDDARVDLPDGLVVHAQPLHDAETEVLRNRVGLLCKPVEDGAPLVALEVQRDAPLVAVHRLEVGVVLAARRAYAPPRIAARGVFDLDHLGAHVGEHHGRPRPVLEDSEVQDFDAVERRRHVSALPSGLVLCPPPG